MIPPSPVFEPPDQPTRWESAASLRTYLGYYTDDSDDALLEELAKEAQTALQDELRTPLPNAPAPVDMTWERFGAELTVPALPGLRVENIQLEQESDGNQRALAAADGTLKPGGFGRHRLTLADPDAWRGQGTVIVPAVNPGVAWGRRLVHAVRLMVRVELSRREAEPPESDEAAVERIIANIRGQA